jgi:hypothetical protein
MSPLIDVLSFWLLQEPPTFEQVFYLDFFDADAVEVNLIHPANRERFPVGFDPEKLRGGRFYSLNPRAWQLKS